jgi:hypothetical protein
MRQQTSLTGRARLLRPSPTITPIVVRVHRDAALPVALRDWLQAEVSDGRFTGRAASRLTAAARMRDDRDGGCS